MFLYGRRIMARSKEFDEKQTLKKAMELFWEQGYEKTSMQDLVDHMGIHRRSIYDTFGDKRTLFLSALTYYEEFITTKLMLRLERDLPTKQKIQEVFMFVINSKVDSDYPKGCLTVNTAVELSLLDEEIAQIISDMFSRTEKLFYNLLIQGQNKGEISNEHNPELLSLYLNNTLVGLRVLVKTNYNSKNIEKIVDLTLSVLD